MAIPKQTAALLRAARELSVSGVADAILILTETQLDWSSVKNVLVGCRLLVAADTDELHEKLSRVDGLDVVEIDPDPFPSRERISIALLGAIASEKLHPGSHVVVLYNGIASPEDHPEPIDSLSLIHLDEHLEKMTAQDLRKLNSPIPLETLRLVVDLASEIGREGREGKAVGTMLVVGDTRKVLSMSRPINYNPFRGYSREERDLRDPQVREQIKDIAQLDGALLITRDGIAVAACLHLDVPGDGIHLGKGFGTRHRTAAAISRKTAAVAVVVSQSSGTVRIFQQGEMVMHIEPLARPHVWQPFRLENQESSEGSEE